LGAKLSNKDWCSAAMEGSVRVRINGIERTFNYASSNSKQQVDCSAYFPHKVGGTRFKVAKGPFGDGVKNYMLVPFRTIAVDRNVIPYGSLVYIPAAKGTQIKLPDGRNVLHDGYFFAGDTGSAIKENHIDVFIGVAKKNPFPWVKSSASKTFEAHIVENKEFAGALNTLHTKK
jgi:3D (Asp-Asp-Asp) domain-containing protein